MRRYVAILLCVCLVSVGTAQTEVEYGRPRALTYAAEFGSGIGIIALGAAGLLLYVFALTPLIGTAVFVVHYLVTGDDDMGDLPPSGVQVVATTALVASIPFVSGAGVARVGSAMGDRRGVWPAVAGAYAGAAAGVGPSYLVYRSRPHENGFSLGSDWPYIAVSVATTALGATIGYNLGRATPDSNAGVGARLGLPSLSITRAELDDGTVIVGASVRLLDLRF
jgi:hypothetical protein